MQEGLWQLVPMCTFTHTLKVQEFLHTSRSFWEADKMKQKQAKRERDPDKPNNLPFLERSGPAGRLLLGAPGGSAKGPPGGNDPGEDTRGTRAACGFAILPRYGHTTEAAT